MVIRRLFTFAVMVWGVFAPDLSAQTRPATVQAPSIRELVVSAMVNGVKVAEAIEALDVNGLGVLLTRPDFEKLGLVNVVPRIVTRGTSEYVSLSRTPGLKVTLNTALLELNIAADAALFAATRASLARGAGASVVRDTGLFANYDLSALASGSTRSYNGFVELVGFTPWGSLISTGVTTYVNGATNSVRLETAFQREFPDSRTRLRIGDSATIVGQFGSSVRFGGIQYGTDDAVDPRFVWRPLLSFAGSAAVPSTIDVFVNNGFQRRFDVPPGTFSVDEIATVAGRGNARIVVRDVTGREVVIEQPFFTVPGQLRKGFSRYSISAGWLRDGYALESNGYSSPMVAAYWRYGLTDSLTTELRIEGKKDGPQLVGGALLIPFGDGHSISTFAAGSRGRAGDLGAAGGVNYTWTGTRGALGVQAEMADRDYETLATVSGEVPTKLRIAANASANFGDLGSVSALYARTQRFNERPVQQAGLNHFYPISKEWKLSTGFNHSLTDPKVWSAFLGLSWYGGNGLSGALTNRVICDSFCERTGRQFEPQAYLASRTDSSQGLSWQIDATRQRARATAEYASNYGIFGAEAFGGPRAQEGGRLSARGSLVAIDGRAFAGQTISDSFIVVRAPEAQGVPVLASGTRGLKLDATGSAVLNRITGYETVTVRVNQEDLPLDVSATSTSATLAVPSKAGAVARIQAKRTKPATFTLVDAGGQPITVGIATTIGNEKTKVGLDGLVYIEEYVAGGKGQAVVGNRRCEFALPATTSTEMMPYLGNVTCDLRAR